MTGSCPIWDVRQKCMKPQPERASAYRASALRSMALVAFLSKPVPPLLEQLEFDLAALEVELYVLYIHNIM